MNQIIVDYLRAAAPILSAIAWPVAVVVVLLTLRHPLREALTHVIEASFGSAKVRFDRAAPAVTASVIGALEGTSQGNSPLEGTQSRLADSLSGRADTHPVDVIVSAWTRVERWYQDALLKHGLASYAETRRFAVTWMARMAVEKGLVPESTASAIDGLDNLYRLAISSPSRQIGADSAREFLVLTDAVLFSLTFGLSQYEKNHPPVVDPEVGRE